MLTEVSTCSQNTEKMDVFSLFCSPCGTKVWRQGFPVGQLDMFPNSCSSFFLSLDLIQLFRVVLLSLDMSGIPRNKSPPAQLGLQTYTTTSCVFLCMNTSVNKLWLMHATRTLLHFKNEKIFSTCNKSMRFK